MLRALLAIAAAVALAFTGTASADPTYRVDADLFPAAAEKYGEGLTERYLSLWKEVGPDEAGANLVIGGAPKQEVAESADRLDRWANPPPVAPVGAATPEPTVTSTYSAPAASSGGCPASMAAEADSPTDVNPTSGAAGCYQVIPSTAAAMGDACADVNAPSCLAAICAAQGNSAWAASGSTPC